MITVIKNEKNYAANIIPRCNLMTMNMKHVFVIGYIGFLIILLYFYLSSKQLEKQTPEFIKEKYMNLPKPLLERIIIFVPISIMVIMENDLIEFIAFTMFVYIICRDYVRRNKFYRNPY